MIRHSFDDMVSRLLEVITLFQTNKSYLYFLSNNYSFHSKHFIKSFINLLIINVWLLFIEQRLLFTEQRLVNI